MPLLSNKGNHRNWPAVVAQDVSQHVHSLKSTVYQVKGQVNGQTVLPLPVGVERVHQAEKMLRERYRSYLQISVSSMMSITIINHELSFDVKILSLNRFQ